MTGNDCRARRRPVFFYVPETEQNKAVITSNKSQRKGKDIMKGIEIRKALYQGNETAETLGISMRETFPVGCDACSASRPKSTHTGPKISQVMTLIERDAKGGPLFKMGYTSDGRPMIDYKGNKAIGEKDGDKIDILSSDLTDEFRVGRMAIWISFLLFAQEKAREKDAEIEKAFASYRTWSSGSMEPGDRDLKNAVALLCDKFYYEFVKQMKGYISVKPLAESAENEMVRIVSFRNEDWYSPECAGARPEIAKESRPADGFDASAFIGDVWSGKFLVDYAWPEDMRRYIPSLDGFMDFVPSVLTERIIKKIHYRFSIVLERMKWIGERMNDPSGRRSAMGHDDVNILITGTPGSGKTYNIQFICAALGIPCFVQAINKDTEEGALTEKITFIEDRLQSVMTDCLRCAENGGALVLEEVNLGMANVLQGVLGQFVEYPFIMQKGDRKIVRHPLCVVFATMNPRTEGTMHLNEAFVSRMRHPYRMEEPSEDEFVSILAARTGEEDGLCRSVYRTYKRVRETIESYRNDIDSLDTDSVLQSLSIRACCATIEDIQEGCTLEEAIESSIIGLIAVHNEEMADRVSRAVRMMY